ncbi:hypothetical protein LSCM1_04394 [Leishmania martiniquensis]|uniref:Uncharacterized protein n=1 Tax=Leishmania martiniquensis TaxID=1580590 RepID=A0A836KEZ4_9TRYP|nr:hypothetical protein LSCM1_04394 [Leishmania martiniquensis]
MDDSCAPSAAALAAPTQVEVKFASDDAAVPSPKALIGTTDEGGRAPRNRESRRIQFLDDGKLFEGHFTVQSRNLKSIIQYLVDRQNEQDVVIGDLQKQVHLLRHRHLKAKQRAAGDGGRLLLANVASGEPSAGHDVGGRVKRIEQFLQLWGVRLADVAELVAEHGDPVITPDAYTSYLVDLPAFRFTRSEARAFTVSASQQPVVNAAAAASDTAARRRNNTPRPETASAGSSSDPDGRYDDRATKAALEKANAALKKAETLLEELRSVSARVPLPPSSKSLRADGSAPDPVKRSTGGGGSDNSGSGGAGGRSGGGDGGGSAVDHEARAEIEELGDYVMRRFQELEAQSIMTAASVARATAAPRVEKVGGSSGNSGGGCGAAAGKAASARPKHAPAKKSAANANSPTREQGPPPAPHMVSADVVDTVAREDAAMSLDLLEELEATMERRFKEVNSVLAKIAVRTVSLAKNNTGGPSSAAEPEKQQQRPGSASSLRSGTSKSRSPHADKRAGKNAEAKPIGEDTAGEVEESRVPASASPMPPSTSKVSRPSKGKSKKIASDLAGPLLPSAGIDHVAREETAALSDRLSDLEEELLQRWQAMDERLCIIGRASMKQAATNPAAGPGGTAVTAVNRAPVVDRKAREDAALSLMRLQQLERELAQLKRQWCSDGGSARPAAGSAEPVTVGNEPQFAMPIVSTGPSVPLRDTYGSKVADLEKEVEQRMADVNQAIAQLRVGTMTLTRDLGAAGLAAEATAGSVPAAALSDLHTLAWMNSSAAPAEGNAILPDQPQTHRSAVASPSASSAQSHLILRAVDEELPPAATECGLPKADSPQPDAALQLLGSFGYRKSSDIDRVSANPVGGTSPGPKRMTVSRLRAPDAPTFGSLLVQRAVVDLPANTTVAAAEEGANAAGRHFSVGSGAAAATTLTADARCEVTAAGKSSYLERHPFSVSPPPGASKGSKRVRMSDVRGESPAPQSSALQHRHETRGHTEPCVVVSCVWCDAEAAEPAVT